MKKNICLLLILLLGYLYCYTQNPQGRNLRSQANVGNIINAYTPVLGLSPCKNGLVVEDASAFNVGDTVLIIQMKGAVIDSTNTATFGTLTDYKNAGNYEFNYVKGKTGNTVELLKILNRTYDIPTGKVQLIRVPYYETANVTSTLTCLPWDGSKGGVLVLNARDAVNLFAPIDVTGRGFRGGQIINPRSFLLVCHENNYYYPVDPIKASPKGEGIAIISPARSYGRGPLGNGGGGGQGHNSGGGGGGNISAGGQGGKEWFNCSGGSQDNGGLGGKALAYNTAANKIYLGGGAGAGNCDNPPGFNSHGGNGGGIIIIQTSSIQTNGNKIIADGAGGAECNRATIAAGGCHEGMGGGGAGGTVLIKASAYLDNIAVNVKGGKGADMNGEAQLQEGPGGGGSGGVVWLSAPSLPALVSVTNTGGINGVNTLFGNDPYNATPGSARLECF